MSTTSIGDIFTPTGISVLPSSALSVSPDSIETLDHIPNPNSTYPPATYRKPPLSVKATIPSSKDVGEESLLQLVQTAMTPMSPPPHSTEAQLKILNQKFHELRQKNVELLALTKRYTHITLSKADKKLVFSSPKENLQNLVEVLHSFVQKLNVSPGHSQNINKWFNQTRQALTKVEKAM